jgi:hypothetical protein
LSARDTSARSATETAARNDSHDHRA